MTRTRTTAAGLLALLASAGAHAAITPDACDKSYQAVLHPAAASFDARAVWLDRRLIAFPGAMPGGVFKLYHSPRGSISAPAGGKVAGAAGALTLGLATGSVPPPLAARFKWVGAGPVLQLDENDLSRIAELHREQLVLVQEDAQGAVLAATRVQVAGALDDLYAAAAGLDKLGVDIAVDTANRTASKRTGFSVWAPTAQQAAVCVYNTAGSTAHAVYQLRFDPATGAWNTAVPGDLTGKYYKYAVEVPVDGMGIVRNLVTDPYSISLSTDSKRSYIARLDAPRLKPAGWDASPAPQTVRNPTDMVVYELHVRDFSINDDSVPERLRGKYGAFTRGDSNGVRHLAALAKSGLTDIHLLPVYDIGSVPETGCAVPRPTGAPDSEAQQALIRKTAETDCFNWGYDPYHYNAPEGSYATDPADGARRIVEFREMVGSLHRLGLRVGMDVVFNHTFIAGQNEKSVLDRVVPGYYHRLNATGAIERSTCCDNTATENLMMGKLMSDSVTLWATQYKIDSFRFDLMGHQPRAVMEALQQRVNAAAGRPVQLIGEGWNFGEVANGARFVQASQLSLNGSGIGTFNDRTRDAVRGGSAGDSGEALFARQGWINGLVYDANAHAGPRPAEDLLRAADMVRAGLAGSIRSYPLQTFDDKTVPLEAIDYGGQPAAYASEPSEVVNYVENHDNQTLYDIDVFKLPASCRCWAWPWTRSRRASPTTTPASTCCARSRWTATASTRATGSTASTGLIGTTTSAPACRRRRTTARITRCSSPCWPTRPSSRHQWISPSRATPSATCWPFAPARPCSACRPLRTSGAACASSTPARPRTRPWPRPTSTAKATRAPASRASATSSTSTRSATRWSIRGPPARRCACIRCSCRRTRPTSARPRRRSTRPPERSAFRRGRRWCSWKTRPINTKASWQQGNKAGAAAVLVFFPSPQGDWHGKDTRLGRASRG
jgi:pullulanase/glycogen debranching enzyme